MDKIFESYTRTLFEGIMKRKYEFDSNLRGKIEKVMKDIAKRTGAKYDQKNIDWSEADLSKQDVISPINRWSRNQKSNELNAFVIQDSNSDLVQVIILFGGNSEYNRVGRFIKVSRDDQVVGEFEKFLGDLKPMPSAADVNAASSRFRNGRL